MTFKNFLNVKKTEMLHLVLGEKRSSLKSCHQVLWSLKVLTSQRRLYGMELVIRKGRYYHLLSVLSKAGCIASFILNS
jgi:hypothetical protein